MVSIRVKKDYKAVCALGLVCFVIDRSLPPDVPLVYYT